MRLIPEAKNWWKMWSMQAMTVAGIIQLSVLALPSKWIGNVVFNDYTWTDIGQISAFVSTVLGLILRQVKQENV